jgi:hypothetical protein
VLAETLEGTCGCKVCCMQLCYWFWVANQWHRPSNSCWRKPGPHGCPRGIAQFILSEEPPTTGYTHQETTRHALVGAPDKVC